MSQVLIKVIGSMAVVVALVGSFGVVHAASNPAAPLDGQVQMLPGVATSVTCLVDAARGPLGY